MLVEYEEIAWKTLGIIPKFTGLQVTVFKGFKQSFGPIIVWVLPELVWPYAIIHVLNPSIADITCFDAILRNLLSLDKCNYTFHLESFLEKKYDQM